MTNGESMYMPLRGWIEKLFEIRVMPNSAGIMLIVPCQTCLEEFLVQIYVTYKYKCHSSTVLVGVSRPDFYNLMVVPAYADRKDIIDVNIVKVDGGYLGRSPLPVKIVQE
jgi:hypothetical protein